MRTLTLLFFVEGSLDAFLLECGIKNAEVNYSRQTISATLTEEEIATACIDYSAEVEEENEIGLR